MTRKRWWLTWGVLVALGGAARAEDGPCKPPPAPNAACGAAKDLTGYIKKDGPSEIERRIEQKLLWPYSLSFKDTPLKQVIEDLHNLTGVNVVADTAALEEAGVSLEQPLSLKVEDMSLKSALTILLRQARLAYVIKDEALQITTEERARGQFKMVTYSVADLVTPIGSGESELAPFLCRAVELKNLSKEYKRSSGQTCEDLLLRLVTQTVEPNTWNEAGGVGTAQYFPLDLALVICQTQDVHEQIQDLLAALRRLQKKEDKEYQLEAKLYERRSCGAGTQALVFTQYQVWPRVTFVRGQQLHLSIGEKFLVRDGSLHDFLSTVSSAPSLPIHTQGISLSPSPLAASKARARPPVEVEVGVSLRAKLTAAEGNQLRLDAALQINEMTEATPEGMQLVGQTYRLFHHVGPGKPVKLVLSRDDDGQPRKWVEMTITEVPEEQEQIHLGTIPPRSR